MTDWKAKLRTELDRLSKEELIDKIITKRAETYSKTGKRNVSTSKTHERRCKKLLTEWSGVEFRRRRIEGRGDDVSVVEGVADIIPVRGQVKFAIESKKGEKFSLNGLFTNPHGAKFTEWWHQVNYDALLLTEKTADKKWPMLFFKPHPNWDWIALPTAVFNEGILSPKDPLSREQAIDVDCWFPHITFDAYHWLGPIAHNIASSNCKPVMKELQLLPCIMCRWHDFAANVSPEQMFVQEVSNGV